jgi:hypothetical protein
MDMVDMSALEEDEDAVVEAVRGSITALVRTYIPEEGIKRDSIQVVADDCAERFLNGYYRIGIVGSRKLSLKTVRAVFETLTTSLVLGTVSQLPLQLELVDGEEE